MSSQGVGTEGGEAERESWDIVGEDPSHGNCSQQMCLELLCGWREVRNFVPLFWPLRLDVWMCVRGCANFEWKVFEYLCADVGAYMWEGRAQNLDTHT